MRVFVFVWADVVVIPRDGQMRKGEQDDERHAADRRAQPASEPKRQIIDGDDDADEDGKVRQFQHAQICSENTERQRV